ncbi:sugar kinase [Rhodocytophaga aerolata]|uniref:Sugar kinase n=1 Tax=Rhodocytophaga aerolata TaxID=455078 RepID=A0ABT8REL5_9BACT|nr:sugar kinase [Rhodocytophaga aerolata]MDO1449157.1 sugar kinase [Rhodocytophaga aerolata]
MKKVVTFGEIMLRLSTPGYAKFIQADNFNITYGGGEANVGISLAQFGIPAEHVTRFPDNDLGKAATSLLRKYGVQTANILYGGDRLGIYFLETGAIARPSKVVYDRANSAFAQLEPGMLNWEEILKEAQWLHWTGITPAISDGAAKSCLEAITVANKLGLTVSADTNYRKNLWQYGKTAREVMPEMVAGCDIIVCSKGDAADMFGIEPKKGEGSGFVSVCKQLMNRFPKVKKIVNTKRESISASHNTLTGVMWNGAEYLKTPMHQISPIVDRIGGGDAFMAGLIYGLLTYNDDQQALDFAVAASALKHAVEGDANLVTAEEVIPVMKGDSSGRLVR